MSLARKILGNTFIQFGGKLATAALSIISLKIITGYLGENGYGDYTLIYNYLALFGVMANFGIFTITVKEMSAKKADHAMILGNALGLRTILTLIAMGLAIGVTFLFPKYQEGVIPIGTAIAAFSTFITLMSSTVSTVLQVNLKMKYETLGLILGKILSLGYMAMVVYVWFAGDKIQGFYHLMWAGVIGNFIMLAITTFFARRYTKISYRFDFSFWKKLFTTALPYGVALVLGNLYFRIDVILLDWLLPQGQLLADGTVECAYEFCSQSQVGLYGVGMRFLELLIIIPIYFMNAVLPTMTRYLEESKQRVRQLVQYAFDFLSSLGLPIMVGGILLATPLILLISNADFLAGEVYAFGSESALKVLMFAMIFSFLGNLFGFVLVGINEQKKLMWINFTGLAFNIVANIFAIRQWGFMGAAATSVLSEIVILIFSWYYAAKSLEMKINFNTVGKSFLSALVMGGGVWSVYQLLLGNHFLIQLGILVPLGALIYGGMIWVTKAITPEMWQLLRKK